MSLIRLFSALDTAHSSRLPRSAYHNLIACRLILLALGIFLLPQIGSAQAPSHPQLHILTPDNRGWIRLSSDAQTGAVFSVETSTNLIDWKTVAVTHDAVVDYPDASAPATSSKFYRAQVALRTGTNDWKNQIQAVEDPFLSSAADVVGQDFRWIKFSIPLTEPNRVYYQDSQKYSFHYDFASKRLPQFQGMSSKQFDAVALRTNRQQVLLGTVLIPPFPVEGEYGIQFVGQDAYPAEMISKYFDLVQSTIVSSPATTAFYVPTFEQSRVAETNRTYFESRGIHLASADRWISGDDVYSTGWALGRLKFFAGGEIDAAFRDGRLLPQDILLTDVVPAEVPVVAGVLTLTPSTPNSHVAILSKSFNLPFAYISDPALRTRVQGLVGKNIVLRLDPYYLSIRVFELEETLDPGLRQEILSLKLPPKLNVVAKSKYGKISAGTDALTPADMRYFGGKASNFGFLRRQIPENSPGAMAFSFDLWDAFLDQVLPNGQTLRAEIQDRLAGYAYPANVAQLAADLAEIRSLITKTATFSDAQKLAIIEALSTFPEKKNLRFRSSTNVEDSELFTGAGLYDSFSGCLEDDRDNDTQGPSQCDPTEPEERGVFRAIQKVYASFYNNNAVLERLRHQIDENSVGMAVLVHYSSPDEIELANGVATLHVTRGGEFGSVDGDLVTQKGAASVTNPDGTAKPEVVSGYHHSLGAGGFLKQRSSLVPLGAYVMDWKGDYVALMNLFAKVADGYYAHFPAKPTFTLDFEYKKLEPGVLQIKQVREVPVSHATNNLQTYLVHSTNDYWVLQGEAADVFSNHRLKSFWGLDTRNLKLDVSGVSTSLYQNIQGEYLDEKVIQHVAGSPATFPGANHTVENDDIIDHWKTGVGATEKTLHLRTAVTRSVDPIQSPVLVLSDFQVQFEVEYATPQPVLVWEIDGVKPSTVKRHSVVLEPRRMLANTNHLQLRTAATNGVKVETEFYWPTPPSKGIGEKTAPLALWKETRITGLTSKPIALRGQYSQTYRPGHHNFSEEFIFEPGLEEGIDSGLLTELATANVKFIHVLFTFDSPQITVLGLDGKFRKL